MQKVYLILRNNKQSGPHSLDELLGLGLRGDDLIWVEGKSCSWSFPAEIETLKAYLPAEPSGKSTAKRIVAEVVSNNQPTGLKKVFVSLPGNKEKERSREQLSEPTNNDLERKADELRKRAESYFQQKQLSNEEEIVETKYTRSLNDVEEDYTSWVYNKVSKKKKYNKKPILLSTGILVLASAIYFIFQSESPVNEKVQNVLPAQSAVTEPLADDVESPSSTNQSSAEIDASKENKVEKSLARVSNIGKPSRDNVIKEKTRIVSGNSGTTVSKEPVLAEAIENNDNGAGGSGEIEDHSSTASVPSTEQKKTLKEKIGGFFEKMKTKKTSDEETNDASVGALPPAGSERKSTKRGEEMQKVVTTDLSSYAQVYANQASGNWMMGVRGLKVVLRNNGSDPIQKAIVEVSYYNDQNDLLDKKQVQFSNIAAKKSGTQTAPDHRLADHADVRLISAIGSTANGDN